MNTMDTPPPVAMLRMLNGFHVTQLLALTARLGVADMLADGPKTAEELAGAATVQPDALYRALRALANMGVFEELSERRFALTPLGATLRTDHPDSLRAHALFLSGEVYRAWADLQYSVTTGKPAFDHVFGAPLFAYMAEHPASSEVLNQAMSMVARRETLAMVAAYDFSETRTVVDVGGGQGMLLSAILQANPALRGTLFDQPHVVAGAELVLRVAGVEDRCELVGGDFFQVLVLNGGRERTAGEYEQLLTAAGLRLSRVIPTRTTARVIEGALA